MVEQVTIQTTDTSPSLEETAAAQDAANQTPAEPQLAGEEAATERPEWLPEKFNTVEDMAKAYAELEKTNSTPEETNETAEAAEAVVEGAGLDMEGLSAEYATNGELTEESLGKLAAVGITPDMVESYIAGQEAQAQSITADLLESVDGDIEVYGEMTSWAADSLPDAEIDAFNTVLESGNNAAIKMAVQNLSTKYTNANGQEPGRVLTGKGSTAGASVYESTADLMKDMGNPEYHNNSAFRAKVEAKLGRSSIL